MSEITEAQLGNWERQIGAGYSLSVGHQRQLIQVIRAAREPLRDAIVEAALAFRVADKERMAWINGCVMPDPTPGWIHARDEYRRATDAYLAARDTSE